MSSRRSSGCSLRSSSSSSEARHASPPNIMEGPLLLSHHHVRGDSSDSMVAPPTFSRLPPDGHEFPPDYRDPSLSSSGSSYHHQQVIEDIGRSGTRGWSKWYLGCLITKTWEQLVSIIIVCLSKYVQYFGNHTT